MIYDAQTISKCAKDQRCHRMDTDGRFLSKLQSHMNNAGFPQYQAALLGPRRMQTATQKDFEDGTMQEGNIIEHRRTGFNGLVARSGTVDTRIDAG